MKIVKKKSLHYKSGKSNKVYNIYLVEGEKGFLVNFEYGRYGSKLRRGTKTEKIVDLETGEKIFKSLVSSKIKKGYVENRERDSISREDYIKILIKRLEKVKNSGLIGTEINLEIDNYKISRLIYRAGELKVKEVKNTIIQISNSFLEIYENKNIDRKIKRDIDNIFYSTIFFLGRVGENKNDLKVIKSLKSKLKRNSKYIADFSMNLIKIRSCLIKVEECNSHLKVEAIQDLENELKENSRSIANLFMNLTKIRNGSLEINLEEIKNKRIKKVNIESKIMNSILINYSLSSLSSKDDFREYIFQILFGYDYDGNFDENKIKYLLIKFYKLSYLKDDLELFARIVLKLSMNYSYKNYFQKRNLRVLKRFALFEQEKYIQLAKNILISNEFYPYDLPDIATFIMDKNLKLWEKNIDVLLELLLKSRIDEVQEFSTNILKNHKAEISEKADTDLLINIFKNLINVDGKFLIFEILKERYRYKNDLKIFELFILDSHTKIANYGIKILKEKKELIKNVDLVIKIIKNGSDKVFKEVLKIVKESSDSDLEILTGEIIEFLLKSEEYEEYIEPDRVIKLLNALSKYITLEHLEKLIDQKEVNEIFLIGLELIKQTDIEIPLSLKEKIGQFDHPDIIVTMLHLLKRLDSKSILRESKLLAHFIYDENRNIRNETKKLIKIVAKEEDSKELLNLIIQKSFSSTNQDIQKDVLIAVNYLKPSFKTVSKDTVYRLIMAKSKLSNEIGARLLNSFSSTDFSVNQWIQFAKNQNKIVRKWAFKAYKKNRNTIKNSMPKPLEIFDTFWEDSRDFAKEYFKNFDLTVDEVLIIADSNYFDVQLFAKKMVIEKSFNQEELVYKLSQHPSRLIQKFTVELITKGVSSEEIIKLERFFNTILLSINKNRLAKDLIINFLNSKIEQREIAHLFGELAKKHYKTVVKSDRENFIEVMYEIKSRFSDIDLPIQIIQDVEVKNAI